MPWDGFDGGPDIFHLVHIWRYFTFVHVGTSCPFDRSGWWLQQRFSWQYDDAPQGWWISVRVRTSKAILCTSRDSEERKERQIVRKRDSKEKRKVKRFSFPTNLRTKSIMRRVLQESSGRESFLEEHRSFLRPVGSSFCGLPSLKDKTFKGVTSKTC